MKIKNTTYLVSDVDGTISTITVPSVFTPNEVDSHFPCAMVFMRVDKGQTVYTYGGQDVAGPDWVLVLHDHVFAIPLPPGGIKTAEDARFCFHNRMQ